MREVECIRYPWEYSMSRRYFCKYVLADFSSIKVVPGTWSEFLAWRIPQPIAQIVSAKNEII